MTEAAHKDKDDYAEGAVIGGYVVVRLIGRGAMGTVYEARNPQIDKRVALKVLDGRMLASKEMLQRFQNEARAASRIEHPGIVNVFDFNRLPDGTAYLVMELIHGEPLTQAMRRAAGPLPDALRLARQIALALTAAHERNIVHRDLKPGNVMLLKDPEHPTLRRAKVVDFGIAKLAAVEDGLSSTRSDLVMGTPAYMAPEQCRGAGAVTERADVYSLGIMLYEMLTGGRPYSAQTQVEMMYHHMNAEPESLARRRPELPAALHTLMRDMLLKSPADRPSMAQVAQALAALTETGRTEAITLEPDTRDTLKPDTLKPVTQDAGPQGTRAPGRRWGIVAALGFAAAAAAGVAAWFGAAERQPTLRPIAATAAGTVGGERLPVRPRAAARTVRWSVESEPAGAEVVLDGLVLGTTPWQGERPLREGQVQLTLRKRGHAEKTVVIDASANVHLAEALHPERRPATRPRPAAKPGPKIEPKPEPKIEIVPLDPRALRGP